MRFPKKGTACLASLSGAAFGGTEREMLITVTVVSFTLFNPKQWEILPPAELI